MSSADSDDIPSDGLRPLRVFISAAEHSGDLHAADLIRAIQSLRPRSQFFGVAGPRMQAQGCEALDDLTDRSAMLLNAVAMVRQARRLLKKVRDEVIARRPDLAIVVDSPALHLPMAKVLKNAGVPVLYYIAPQLWAWAPWRIRRLRKRVKKLAAILPFEESYFRERGMDATYVGHPLVEQLGSRAIDPEKVKSFRSRGSPVIACLPGSRKHVVEEVLPGQLEVARAILQCHPQARFIFSAASAQNAEAIEHALQEASFKAEIARESNGEVLSAADLVLCASGTATLEVAWYGVPMVVMYNGSKWGYRLVGRFLVRTPSLSLVNILSGSRIVPEFMPYYTSTLPIAAEALDLLTNAPRRERIKEGLSQVVKSLGEKEAATGAARIAVDLAEQTHIIRSPIPRRPDVGHTMKKREIPP